jgi:hypothetical protein
MWVSDSSFYYHKHYCHFSDIYLLSFILHALISILPHNSGPVTVVRQGIMVIITVVISAMKMLSIYSNLLA